MISPSVNEAQTGQLHGVLAHQELELPAFPRINSEHTCKEKEECLVNSSPGSRGLWNTSTWRTRRTIGSSPVREVISAGITKYGYYRHTSYVWADTHVYKCREMYPIRTSLLIQIQTLHTNLPGVLSTTPCSTRSTNSLPHST